MLKFIKNFFLTIIAGGIASFFVISSIVFGQDSGTNTTHDYVSGNEVKKYILSEGVTVENTKTLIYKTLTAGQVPKFGKSDVLYVDFGRLASAFLLPGSGSTFTATDVLSISGYDATLKQDSPTIISLYDPFSSYTIHSFHGDYSINQITNGSFYIGAESNNTVSLYSIDAVIRLNFLYQGEHMADIVLFPGMYVRFNPSFNNIFKGVIDPFRVAQVVGSDNIQDDSAGTTGIEFINPRMEIAGTSDTFFVYRLPPTTRILFQMLHTMFHDKVAQIDIMKSYASDPALSSEASSNSWLLNPSKINHFLLLELKGALSQGLQSQTTQEAFTRKIGEIRKRAEGLAIGNSVNKTFEEFLTDGRFALFSSTVSSKYEKIYQEMASIVGITPSTGKAKLFQKLSDIYSHNLVTQKKDLTFSKIDTYSPTAAELQATLSSTDISHKDYFDIALYAFSILEKAKNKRLFESQAITAHATYQLLSTLFVATSKYASSVEDPDQQAKTYRSIALNFYDPILRILSRSLFYYYTTTDDKGRIFLNDKALNSEGKIRLTRDLIRDIKLVDSTARGILTEILPAYINQTDTNTILSIKRSVLRIRSFAGILQDDVYLTYQLHPYVSVLDDDVSLPEISDDDSTVVIDTGSTELPVVSQEADTTTPTQSSQEQIPDTSSGVVVPENLPETTTQEISIQPAVSDTETQISSMDSSGMTISSGAINQ